MSLLFIFSLITLVSTAPLPQNGFDSRFTFTTPEIFNFTFTTPTPANASPNDTLASDEATVPISTVQVSQGTTMEVDTTVPLIVLPDSEATVISGGFNLTLRNKKVPDLSVQSTDPANPPAIIMNMTQNDASANQETSSIAPLSDQTDTTVVSVVQYDHSASTAVPVMLNDASQTVDVSGTSTVPVVVFHRTTVVPAVTVDPTGTTPMFIDATLTPDAPSLVQDTSVPLVLNSSDASINYVARDAASQAGTTVVPVEIDQSRTPVQTVSMETTMLPNQEETMTSINFAPIMADVSSTVDSALLDTTVAPLDYPAFQTTGVPVVADSSATSTPSLALGIARDAPVDLVPSSTTIAPVPVVNNGEELVSSMALPFGNITILQTIHITLSANQTVDAPINVPVASTDGSLMTSDSVTGQSVEEPVPVVNIRPIFADPAQQPSVDPIVLQDPSTLHPQLQVTEEQSLPADQQQQLDFVNYQQADASYNTAYQYLNLTESQAQNLLLNISLPVSPQNLLSRLSRTAEQMNYEGKLDLALQLTAMSHNLMTEVDSDLERRN